MDFFIHNLMQQECPTLQISKHVESSFLTLRRVLSISHMNPQLLSQQVQPVEWISFMHNQMQQEFLAFGKGFSTPLTIDPKT